MGMFDGIIAGGRNTAVGAVDDRDARVDTSIHVADRQADIFAAVVDEQDLQIFIPLFADALDAAGQIGRRIVDGDHDTDKRCGHEWTSSLKKQFPPSYSGYGMSVKAFSGGKGLTDARPDS